MSAPDFGADFDVGAVQRADRERAVHAELHVAGARGLFAGRRNLFGQIRRRVDALRVGDVEIREKYHFQPVADVGVAIDHLAHGRDQLDHQLGKVVSGRRLPAENERAGKDLRRRDST